MVLQLKMFQLFYSIMTTIINFADQDANIYPSSFIPLNSCICYRRSTTDAGVEKKTNKSTSLRKQGKQKNLILKLYLNYMIVSMIIHSNSASLQRYFLNGCITIGDQLDTVRYCYVFPVALSSMARAASKTVNNKKPAVAGTGRVVAKTKLTLIRNNKPNTNQGRCLSVSLL